MERIDLPVYTQLGSTLGAIRRWEHTSESKAPGDHYTDYAAVEMVRRQVVELDEHYDFRTSKKEIVKFCEAVQEYEQAIRSEYHLPLAGFRSDIARTLLLGAVAALDPKLEGALQDIPSYVVPQKAGYDTNILIDRAQDNLLPETQAKLSPLALREVREAGRCFAFGLSTACGFHMMRAVEDVLKYYWKAMPKMQYPNGRRVQPREDGKPPNWGDYTTALSYTTEDDVRQTHGLLLAVKRHERDVIDHPERELTSQQAHKVFQTGLAAIDNMAERLRVRRVRQPKP